MNESIEFLYRFRHLQNEHREWTKQLLVDSILYFADPPSFNDPFDCKIHYSNKVSLGELRHYYTGILKEKFPHLNRKQHRKKIASDIRGINRDDFICQMATGMQDSANRLGVLSLSATCENILLWSHYAASHTGICLKFHASSTSPFFGMAQKVKYKDKYPQIDVLTDPDEQVEGFLLTKAKDWEYEEEWRIINHETGFGGKRFPDELLAEVIFGARMNIEDKEEVLSWLSTRTHPIQVSEAQLSTGTYSLKILPYEP